jgi:hypothetical protein
VRYTASTGGARRTSAVVDLVLQTKSKNSTVAEEGGMIGDAEFSQLRGKLVQ